MDNIKKIQEIIRHKGLDAYIIPKNNEFFSSNLQDFEDRLKYVSGFDGSAGTLVVLKDDFLFFTDSRYEIQAKQQLGKEPIIGKSIPKWLRENKQEIEIIGYDGFLHTSFEIKRYFGFEMIDVGNLVDEIWKRDVTYDYEMFDYDLKYCGEDSKSKLSRLKEKLPDVDCYIISNVCEISWLMNKRSNAFKYLPAVKKFMIFYPESLRFELFSSPDDFFHKIKQIRNLCVGFNDKKSHAKVVNMLKHSVNFDCNIPSMMSVKNEVECQNILKVHEIEGLAICEFLSKLEKHDEITELQASSLLDDCRKQSDLYVDKSFETIFASDENGAIVHYHPTKKTDKKIDKMFLLDCGSQYFGGTTDMTRTVMFKGEPTRELINDYTLVLKGHLSLLMTIFPKETRGNVLDGFARQHLWDIGYDYGHGTGHGVGNFLNVHEGPIRISKRSSSVFKSGHIISCEPGIYKEGKYGIRIENLLLVRNANSDFLRFKNLTFVPYDLKLINKDMLSNFEIEYINMYHKKIHDMYIDKIEDKAWLKKVTKDI